MRFNAENRMAATVPGVLLATLLLLFFSIGDAAAESGFFTTNCSSASCHPATPSTCAGCHAHGVHSSSAKNNINLTAQTDQANYAPGATVTVTLNGGYRSGWIRAYLYNDNGTLVDTSTGPSGMGGGASFPVTLTGTAPATAGTYTFTASWYGNQFDAGGAAFGAGWTPDPFNPQHGEELVATNSFTVTSGADTTPPTVQSTVPAANATGVAVNTVVSVTFSEPVNSATVNSSSFFVTDGIDNVAGTFSFVDNTATFTPSADLTAATAYTATVTTAVEDQAGNALAAPQVWTFTTGSGADVTPPTVQTTSPTDNATGVPTNAVVGATFSEPVDPATVNGTSFFISNGVDNVAGTISVVGNTVGFTPSVRLTDNTVYTATITSAVTDVAGNPLASDVVWSFTTGVTSSSSSSDSGGSCAVAPSSGKSAGIPGTFALLLVIAAGSAVRRRIRRGRQ